MKNILRSKKGISLITLVISIAVLVIITNVIIYSLRDNLNVEKIKAMQNDISNLRDKVSTYYVTYGSFPIAKEYKYANEENLDKIRASKVISDAVDTGDFYVIDLKLMDNLTLNYGKDYSHLTSDLEQEQINQFTDLYIMNENSGNIFYVKGVTVNNVTYYTDYTQESIDNKSVDLRYIEGVKIPKGFYYVGGTKDEGIVISDVQGDDLNNSAHGNQFVWVPVDKNTFDEKFKRTEGYSDGQLQSYILNCGEADGTGNNSKVEESNTTKKEAIEMYKSVKTYGGFYIGRFEAGKDTDGSVICQKGASAYADIKWGNSITDDTGGAVEKARNFAGSKGYKSVVSILCYGVQWDATLSFIDPEYTVYAKESLDMGWYVDNYDSTTNGNTETNPNHITGKDLIYSSNPNIITNKQKNIYDMGGNVYEWTMETYSTDTRINRGGAYTSDGRKGTASYRSNNYTYISSDNIGFRITLYLPVNEDSWTEYDQEGVYIDENGDEAYIPAGFSVNSVENVIKDGLVVKDSIGNEYVWIGVPKSVTADAANEIEIEERLIEYTKDYRTDGCTDTWVDGCGLTEDEYNQLKSKMLNSIKDNGGFYIGRYESGTEVKKISGTVDDTVDSLKSTYGIPKIQKGLYIYSYVSVNQSQKLASELSTQDYMASLPFGIQWDLTCKFMEQTGNLTKYELLTDSSGWGNYANSSFYMTEGYYVKTNVASLDYTKIDENTVYKKQIGNTMFASTGSSEKNKALNIYDFAGNEWEWVLSKSSNEKSPFVRRGGEAYYDGDFRPAVATGLDDVSALYFSRGFRVALYK